MKAYFVTATDTDAGKTFVSANILKNWTEQGYKTLGFKPIASGCLMTQEGMRNDDALQLIAASSVSLPYKKINQYSFEPAIAPHIAAAQKGVRIDLQAIQSTIFQHYKQAERVIVEGVGGWLVPLNEQQNVADLACLLNFSVILVVNIRLGCINHALLTAQAIEQRGLSLAGWIANSPEAPTGDGEAMACFEENIQSIQNRIQAPLLGVLPNQSNSTLPFSHWVDMEKCI
ncbi:MAG: dethiobiotin synthase [Gammaproteobacteria bacterium]|nr:dethiobiotin synthase [Gammaproteobacteria bacterium]